MKVLIVDDRCSRDIKCLVERLVPNAEVERVLMLPDDESVLARYDALIIDGEGIGNEKFKDGLEFCKSYDKPEGQAVVFYSGLRAHGKDADELEKRGVANLSKGCDPEKLALSIRFSMEKKI